MTDSLFSAELRDAARINEMEDQRAEMLDAVREASEEAELSDFDPHRDFYAEMEDDPYDGEMWEDAYDDHPADMYEWDCALHNEI